MRKFLFIFVILFYFAYNNISYASNFHFTKVIDETPYVIINNIDILHKTQTFLLHSFLIGDTFQGEKTITLDTLNVETTTELSLYWDVLEYKLWPIIGPPNFMNYTVGFKPGDKLIIQYVTDDGSGEQKEIIVDKVLYNVCGNGSSILLTCQPISLDSNWFYKKHDIFDSPYITHSYGSWRHKAPRGQIKVEIPDIVKLKVDSLSNAFLPKESINELPRVTTQPLRFFHGYQYNEMIYYAAVISYGTKGRRGILYLLDKFGNILQKLEDKNFNKINGITDVDRDGTNELVVFMGDGYGGGIEVFDLELDKKSETVRLLSVGKIATIFD